MVLEGLAQAGGGSAPGRGCPSHSSHVGEEWPDSNAPICQWWGGQQGEGMTSYIYLLVLSSDGLKVVFMLKCA